MSDTPLTIDEAIAWAEENGPRLDAEAAERSARIEREIKAYAAKVAFYETPAGKILKAHEERQWMLRQQQHEQEAFAEYIEEEAEMIDGFLAGLMLSSFALAHNVKIAA